MATQARDGQSSAGGSGQVLNLGAGQVLTVGAGQEFATLHDALRAAVAGDTIAVEAGTYTNDFGTITCPVSIVAVGGMVNEVATVAPPNGKGILTVDSSLTISGFTFSGANDGPYSNLAGIRYENGNLNVSYCYFHDNADGILATPWTQGTGIITIDHSEFGHNGAGDGYSHNLYVGGVASLTITNSYFHDAVVGHEIKSRAASTTITGNVIADGPHGTASYDIDLPNAGVALISNNVIEKGPNASNWYAIHYGGETQIAWSQNSLSILGNTFVNDFNPAESVAILNQSSVNGLHVGANITGDRFWGYQQGRLLQGPGHFGQTRYLTQRPNYSTQSPWINGPRYILSGGPEVLNLPVSNLAVSGGTQLLVLTDPAGSNTITGGSGGVQATVAGGFDWLSTAAAATDVLVLNGRNDTVVSAGHDTITVNGQYDEVDASGAASIVSTVFATYNLDGQDTLSASGCGTLHVGSTGLVTADVTAQYLMASVDAGGSLFVVDTAGVGETLATVAGAASVTVSGGGVSVVTGTSGADVTGGAAALSLADGSGTDIVTFGTGSATVTAGTGADTYVFTASAGGGTVLLQDFDPNADALSFQGFSGDAVASSAITGGSTFITLTNGTIIDVAGVVLQGYGGNGGDGGGNGGGGNGGSGGVTLTTSGNTLAGGASLLAVTDYAGGNSIAGGAGGLALSSGADYDTVSTLAGVADTISAGGHGLFDLAGDDVVALSGLYDTVTATGAATISSASANSGFDLEGRETLSLLGGVVTVGAAAAASVAVGAGQVSLAKAAGGALFLTQAMPDGSQSAVTVTGGAATFWSSGTSYAGIAVSAAGAAITGGGGLLSVVSGGGDTITAGSGQLTLQAGEGDQIAGGPGSLLVYAGGADLSLAAGAGNTTLVGGDGTAQITLGAGTATLELGAGAATLTAIDGAGGGLSIVSGWGGADTIAFQGFGADPIAAETVTGGNTWLTLTDGSRIELLGVTHYG